MFDQTSILKPNATQHDRAVEQSIRKAKPDLTSVATLMNPDTCPAHLLGWLAWAFSVDVWEASWPEATKREVIRAALPVHQRKGTRGAVVAALQSQGFGAELIEWHEYNGTPHTFRITVFVGQDKYFDHTSPPKLRDIVDATKPLRSHYDMTFTVKVDQQIRVGAHASIGGVVRTLALKPTDQTERSRTTLAAISRRGGVHHT